ncbi:hypothetical protein C8R46DRAFT_595751 [Mycena filopes]|nr:hypothetical protein C8R46DRAFT_595751 [Mycena filopes]
MLDIQFDDRMIILVEVTVLVLQRVQRGQRTFVHVRLRRPRDNDAQNTVLAGLFQDIELVRGELKLFLHPVCRPQLMRRHSSFALSLRPLLALRIIKLHNLFSGGLPRRRRRLALALALLRNRGEQAVWKIVDSFQSAGVILFRRLGVGVLGFRVLEILLRQKSTSVNEAKNCTYPKAIPFARGHGGNSFLKNFGRQDSMLVTEFGLKGHPNPGLLFVLELQDEHHVGAHVCVGETDRCANLLIQPLQCFEHGARLVTDRSRWSLLM